MQQSYEERRIILVTPELLLPSVRTPHCPLLTQPPISPRHCQQIDHMPLTYVNVLGEVLQQETALSVSVNNRKALEHLRAGSSEEILKRS